jgi:hypothetical protein
MTGMNRAISFAAFSTALVFGQSPDRPAAKAPHTVPDLHGIWAYTILLPPDNLKVTVNGQATVQRFERGYGAPRNAPVKGALPFTAAPSYKPKPEFQAKVKDLADHESKTDPVFYCGRPGVPRIGPPRKIVQLPDEMIFLYEDVSGDPYRIIPISTPEKPRTHRKNANPSDYGDSVGHWEGDVFVVDVVNFNEDTWFGENGYFHTDAMHVVERLWRDGENLVYQATVEDPNVLTAPWTMAPRVVKPSNEPLEESPRCIESDGAKLLNDDHHAQR